MNCGILGSIPNSNFISQEVKTLQYFYLSDHLGSSSWISDKDGNALQHLSYLPFGEVFANQKAQNSSFDTEYKFLGKERDTETGFDYFGARYYVSELGIWLSVDPMSGKRLWESSYVYCGNNPINRIDPNGMIWDESQLTDSQKEKWQATVQLTSQYSSLFKKMYDDLAKSETVYKVKIGERTVVNGISVPGVYSRKDNTITFRQEGYMTQSDTYMEEMFHAYQHDNLSLYESGKSFNFEFEAKVATVLMKEQAGFGRFGSEPNFEIMDKFLSPNGWDVNMPNATTIKDKVFQDGYMKGAESYRDWNKTNNYGNSHYQQPTQQSPKSLIKLF